MKVWFYATNTGRIISTLVAPSHLIEGNLVEGVDYYEPFGNDPDEPTDVYIDPDTKMCTAKAVYNKPKITVDDMTISFTNVLPHTTVRWPDGGITLEHGDFTCTVNIPYDYKFVFDSPHHHTKEFKVSVT